MKHIALVVLLAAGILRFQMEKNSVCPDQLSTMPDQGGLLAARGRALEPNAHGPRARPVVRSLEPNAHGPRARHVVRSLESNAHGPRARPVVRSLELNAHGPRARPVVRSISFSV